MAFEPFNFVSVALVFHITPLIFLPPPKKVYNCAIPLKKKKKVIFTGDNVHYGISIKNIQQHSLMVVEASPVNH